MEKRVAVATPYWQGLRHCDKGLTPGVSELLSAVVIPIDTALLFAGRRRREFDSLLKLCPTRIKDC